jgi:hypothetical protein
VLAQVPFATHLRYRVSWRSGFGARRRTCANAINASAARQPVERPGTEQPQPPESRALAELESLPPSALT